MKITRLNRRRFLAGIVGAGAALAPGRPAASPLADLARPAERLRAFMMMRGALDSRLVISCIECQYWGVVDAQMTPFYDLVAATFSRSRKAPDGGYDIISHEVEYFIDRQTGLVLDKWANPYTGQTVTAKHTDGVPVKLHVGADCQLRFPQAAMPAGTVMGQQTLPLAVTGNDVWSVETSHAMVPMPNARPVYFNERVINHAKLSDIAAPGRMQARADSTYVGISSFRPWQKMGDHPGEMLGLGHGAVGVSPAELPARWIAASKLHHPEALRDPGAYLEPLWRAG